MIHEDNIKKQAQTDFAFDKSKGIVVLTLKMTTQIFCFRAGAMVSVRDICHLDMLLDQRQDRGIDPELLGIFRQWHLIQLATTELRP